MRRSDFKLKFHPIIRLLRCVIRQWNRNFPGFFRIFLKIAKTHPMKRNSHFSGKWQNLQITELLGIGELEAIVLNMVVNLANGKYIAPNII